MSVERNTALLHAVFGERFLCGFDVRFWDGTVLPSRNVAPAFTLLINEPGALRAAFSPPVDLNTGRAFVEGRLDVEGDIERAIATFAAMGSSRGAARTLRALYLLTKIPRVSRASSNGAAHLHGAQHSRARDRAAISYHYDHPVEFFRTFLDPAMVYSCAYYAQPEFDLEAAQQAKLDYILRKLRLKSGMRFLDIGCGWGSLVLHAAQRYDVEAVGITLSRVQCDEANRRIAQAGLGDRARVEYRDYRDLGDERFDRIASIGMVEHVGRRQMPAYFTSAYNALRPGGLFLNHGIAEQSEGRRGGRATGFVGGYVFPDGELLCVGDTLALAEREGFEVRDVENLREHYVRTLRAWVANIERNRDTAVASAGLAAYRTWRLYMAGSAANFTRANIGVFQSLLGRPDEHGAVDIPPTRSDLYESVNYARQ